MQAWKILIEIEQLLSDSSDKEDTNKIERILETIGRYCEVDRVRITLLNDTSTRLQMAHQWCSSGHDAASDLDIPIDPIDQLESALKVDAGSRIVHHCPLITAGHVKGFITLDTYDSKYGRESADTQLIDYIARIITLRLSLRQQPKRAPATQASGASPANDNGDKPRILIVDDDDINLRLIKEFAVRYGAITSIARNGREATKACKEQHYDAILMDLSMPVLDGFDASREIVTSENLNKTTPIVAVTADVTDGIQRRCNKAGIKHYLSKPLNRHTLFDLLDDITGKGLADTTE